MKQKSGPDKAPAERVLKNIRRQTRWQYSAEEKICIVLEWLRGEENIWSCIRFASERSPGKCTWHIQVHIPGPPFGSAASLDEAKQDFKTAWLASKPSTGRTRWRRPTSDMNKREER